MHYFSSADYLSEGQELTGIWRGHGAARLELAGPIAQQQWDALCQNRDPRNGRVLTARFKTARRIGYDFNFRAPKSLSLLYGITGDERLTEAFRTAVNATMADMEQEMQTRVRRSGKDEDRTTGNMVWGEWIHTTGRPVDGVPDPHLHAHCFVFNTTFDEKEHRWKAGQFAGLKRDAPYFEAVFHSRLAEQLGNLGLEVARGKSGWNIAGLSPDTLRKFSCRSTLIEAEAKRRRIVDPEQMMELATTTREKKRKEIPLDKLRVAWASRLSDAEAATIQTLSRRIGSGVIDRDPSAAERAAELAVGNAFERKSAVPERMLLRDALKRSIGQASVEATQQAMGMQSILLADMNGRRFATTLGILSEETKMIAFARNGRGTCRAFVPGDYLFKTEQLNLQQRAAVMHILRSRDRVMIVNGLPGTGKTTMLKEATSAIEATGTKVFAFAPSAEASRGVLRHDGFKDADTVARLLVDQRLQDEVAGNLLLIDEAGLIGTKTMWQLFDLAERMHCRVLLSGDVRQHLSVERGDALRLLESEAGIAPAELEVIQRQKGRYRDAVSAISQGQVGYGLRIFDELQWLKEIPDSQKRDEALANDYIATIRRGESSLVISPTHAEADRVTDSIRTKMRYRGMLEGAEHAVLSLKSMGITEADRAEASSYQPGDVIEYHQNAAGIHKGQRFDAGHDPLELKQASRFQAFRPDTINLAKGDLIRITKGGPATDGKHTHKVENGAVYGVKGFTQRGDIILSNGWKLSKDFGHLTYGYVSTSYASQGRTVDRLLLSQSAISAPAASLRQILVSTSRGRHSAGIYTDDKLELLDAASRSDDRLAATELMKGRHRRRHAVVIRQSLERFEPSMPSRQRESQTLER